MPHWNGEARSGLVDFARHCVVVFVALVLVLSAAGAGGEAAAAELRAGAAVADITPPKGVSMDGTISQNAPVRAVHDPLRARALVLDDGATRLAIVICDNTMIYRKLLDRAKRLIRDREGLAPERVLVAATHSHATPRAAGISTEPIDRKYYDQIAEGIAEAVGEAIDRLAPAEVGSAVAELPRFPDVRRRRVKEGTEKTRTPFGDRPERVSSVWGRNKSPQRSGPIDPELSVLSVRHADGEPLAILANYGIHYVGGYKAGHVSADYFGVMARRLQEHFNEKDEGGNGDRPPFVGLMSNGTSGNVGSPRRGGTEPWEEIERVGGAIADRVIEMHPGLEHGPATLAMRQRELELSVRKPGERRLKWAEERWSGVQEKMEAGKRLTWPEVYVRETMLLHDWPDREKVILQAIRIGDIGIAAIPCEVFTQTGLSIKDNSPLERTFTIELANGAAGYLPTVKQHELGGYETWPARSSRLEVEAEPKIRKAMLEMLGEVAGSAGAD